MYAPAIDAVSCVKSFEDSPTEFALHGRPTSRTRHLGSRFANTFYMHSMYAPFTLKNVRLGLHKTSKIMGFMVQTSPYTGVSQILLETN